MRIKTIQTSNKNFILKYFRCRDGKRTETRIGMEGICITHSCIPPLWAIMCCMYTVYSGMQEWVIQIPSIPILVSVLFPSLHLKYFRIKFLLLVKKKDTKKWKNQHWKVVQTYRLEYRWDTRMVTIIYEEKDRKEFKNQICIKILNKFTCWSMDEMHAWWPYMKQKDRKKVINQHCIKILSKLTCWSIDEMHAWSPYMKQKNRKS